MTGNETLLNELRASVAYFEKRIAEMEVESESQSTPVTNNPQPGEVWMYAPSPIRDQPIAFWLIATDETASLLWSKFNTTPLISEKIDKLSFTTSPEHWVNIGTLETILNNVAPAYLPLCDSL